MPDLRDLARAHLELAREDPHGRSAHLVAHDGELRQTVIALRAGASLGEHNSPPAATLQVLRGRVRVLTGDRLLGEIGEGELWVLTHERHSVAAPEDAVFLLTTVTSVGTTAHE
ncbi:cupin [Serinibacter arcticus]|uniref:Cupin n=1 Tax=Serinibacter arcticus TaxID=1655435 RepID=A0A2U1ZRF1_9MICO|nr:cupin [Serinibacter arcticus]PWD49569.1 cupin [Serinibacter arcticus]